MNLIKPRIPFSYADYKSLPESMDRRYELMDGELYMVPAPSTRHQAIAQNIEFLLVKHVRATQCGRVLHAPVDVVLGTAPERDVVQPDILFIASERLHILTEAEIAGAPDLIIEILSPGTAERDRGHKKTIYARNGVREYWIVDPEGKCIDVYILGVNGYADPVHYQVGDTLPSTVMRGLQVPIAEVFL